MTCLEYERAALHYGHADSRAASSTGRAVVLEHAGNRDADGEVPEAKHAKRPAYPKTGQEGVEDGGEDETPYAGTRDDNTHCGTSVPVEVRRDDGHEWEVVHAGANSVKEPLGQEQLPELMRYLNLVGA